MKKIYRYLSLKRKKRSLIHVHRDPYVSVHDSEHSLFILAGRARRFQSWVKIGDGTERQNRFGGLPCFVFTLAVCRPQIVAMLPIRFLFVGLIRMDIGNYDSGGVSLYDHVTFLERLCRVNSETGIRYGTLCDVEGATAVGIFISE